MTKDLISRKFPSKGIDFKPVVDRMIERFAALGQTVGTTLSSEVKSKDLIDSDTPKPADTNILSEPKTATEDDPWATLQTTTTTKKKGKKQQSMWL